jgi:hypothetical protein
MIILSSISFTESFSDNDNVLQKMKKYNVIFGGTCRNVGDNIEDVLQNIEKCAKKFNTHSVVIYENDSSDNTRELLQKHKKENYYYIFEDNVTDSRRTKRIERGRNLVLDKVREINNGNRYNYLILLDLDDVNKNGEFVDSIDTCFIREDWDVLTANQRASYYDLWALRNEQLNYDCWKEISDTQPVCGNINMHFEPSQFIEVDSAFGGAAIYKLSSVPYSCKYNGEHPDGQEKCEHVDFNKCIKDNGGKIFINTDFLTGTKGD